MLIEMYEYTLIDGRNVSLYLFLLEMSWFVTDVKALRLSFGGLHISLISLELI